MYLEGSKVRYISTFPSFSLPLSIQQPSHPWRGNHCYQFLVCVCVCIYILLPFRFWGTCKEHAGLLHRYIHGTVVCCLHPYHLYLAFLPMLSLPNSLTPAVPSLVALNRPQCVMLPSLCPCVLIVQHLPVSENMQYLIFCSCVSLLRMMFPDSSMSLQRTRTHPFYGCIVFHGVYVPHFPCPVCH